VNLDERHETSIQVECCPQYLAGLDRLFTRGREPQDYLVPGHHGELVN
jgi:hypothetical protein